MTIPSIISRKAAVAEVIKHVTNTEKPNAIPTCVLLHNGLGGINVSSDGLTSRENERLIIFPLVSSVKSSLVEDFAEYPAMERTYLRDRMEFYTFIDKIVGGLAACAVFSDEDSNYYITVPDKGVSAIVPATLINNSASVRLLLKALPAELPDLFKTMFDEIGKLVTDANKAK